MSDTNQVADDIVVSLDYTLRLDDDQVIDSSEGREPLEFIQGAGHIIPGLERELYGMEVGDQKQVTVQPGDGYGERDDTRIQTVGRDAFQPGAELESGMGVQMQDPQTGQVFQGTIGQVNADNVVIDFNHPLAGETLHFDVEIAGLRTATPEELSHGHVHGPQGHGH
ncbi:MAG: peptidylprolyl isomerase [Anaerolineae bacterium]|nr:peptidylprolyl isomerase [Anaerolineae bacterium]